jgi:type VI secretion system protein ImpL
MQSVASGVAAAYARDYIATWQGVVKALVPADYFHDPMAFGAFTRTPSPLKLVLLEVRKNTTFPAATGPGSGLIKSLNAGVDSAEKMAGAGAASSSIDVAQQITLAFKTLNTYVGDGNKPAPIDDFVAAIKSTGAANAGAAVAGGGLGGSAAQGQLATAVGGLASVSTGAPPELQSFVSSAVQGGKTAQVSVAQGAVADAYRQQLAPICQAAVTDRYPFNGEAANDASISDMLRVFGANGAFDNFTRDRLGSLIDRVGPVWRWNTQDPVGATLNPLAAEAFQKADGIRDLLAAGLPMQVQAAGFGGAVTAVEISAGGVTDRFDTGAAGARPLMWSVSSVPEASVTLFAGTKPIKTFTASGPWALFRLMDKAKQENAGPTAFKATFGEGATFATLKIDLNSDKNPFRRGSLWSFRCPSSL